MATAIGGFNAPGSGGFVGNIAGLFSQTTAGANGVWNVKGSEGLSLISGLGSQASASLWVQTEAASALARQPQTAHAGQRQVLSVRRRSRRSPVQAP